MPSCSKGLAQHGEDQRRARHIQPLVERGGLAGEVGERRRAALRRRRLAVDAQDTIAHLVMSKLRGRGRGRGRIRVRIRVRVRVRIS